MLTFTDCKINIGLDVIRRRPDGYHDIVTCMYHIPWGDIVEIIPSQSGETTLTVLGKQVDCPPEKNLVMKAYRALENDYSLPPVDLILQKIVPDGAGLGGGSSDASHTLRLLNNIHNLGIPTPELAEIAKSLGADCPFFIYDTPMIAEGIGEILTPINLDLSGYTIVIIKPDSVNISTKQAYAGITPAQPTTPLADLLKLPIEDWQGRIKNDFESSIFPLAPQIADIKNTLLEIGAVYASMSGSGASVYGIFNNDKMADEAINRFPRYQSFRYSPS